jgi:peptidoglycan/xylan/chitin deacetylase (PgdA/CDA1 family)
MRSVLKSLLSLFGLVSSIVSIHCHAETGHPECIHPVYLTFDTGHMGVAEQIASVLNQQQVKVTFFVANEPTQQGSTSLADDWANWWHLRAKEGHAFASHTFDHVYWQHDLPNQKFAMRPSAGPLKGQILKWNAKDYCAAIRTASNRIQAITGVPALPLFRAPGGKTSNALIQAAQSCGYQHVGWSKAGFLGDELPSEQFPNSLLLSKALKDIREGDILMAHLGIWSRKDPWAPAVLEPLIKGIKAKGLCFATLDRHPRYASFIRNHGSTSE